VASKGEVAVAKVTRQQWSKQAADQGCGKRVSTRQREGRVFMGVRDSRQEARGRPGERRDVMRRHVSMLRLRLIEGARNWPNGD
jgi:hypothetical protein